jgi:hypothetical protein
MGDLPLSIFALGLVPFDFRLEIFDLRFSPRTSDTGPRTLPLVTALAKGFSPAEVSPGCRRVDADGDLELLLSVAAAIEGGAPRPARKAR